MLLAVSASAWIFALYWLYNAWQTNQPFNNAIYASLAGFASLIGFIINRPQDHGSTSSPSIPMHEAVQSYKQISASDRSISTGDIYSHGNIESKNIYGPNNQASVHQIVLSKNIKDRREAADALRTTFRQLPDKNQAWQDLHILIWDNSSLVRWDAAYALKTVFSQIPNKNQAWQDLVGLTQDNSSIVRWRAAEALGTAFNRVPDNVQAWRDLCSLTQDQAGIVRWGAADALGTAFGQIPDKIQAWQVLLNMVKDSSSIVRWRAAEALGTALGLVPDKNLAWKDLQSLTQERDSNVRRGAAEAVGTAFSHAPDKVQACEVLFNLTKDSDTDVRIGATEAIGTAFGHVPDKIQAWQVLLNLTKDEAYEVRSYAYHSLGRASVLKAAESYTDMDSLKKELEAAVAYFEKSCQSSSTPAHFCYPFYRSYLALTFQGANDDEVQKYLERAKRAVHDSEGKEELLKAVENLAKALQGSQRVGNRANYGKINGVEIAEELDAINWYCINAARHMAAAENIAPGAIRLMKICNPLIKEKIDSIKISTDKILTNTLESGTIYRPLVSELNRAVGFLSLENQIEAYKTTTRISYILKDLCVRLPPDKRKSTCEIVTEIERRKDLLDRLTTIELALLHLKDIDLLALEKKLEMMDNKLNTIIFDLSKIEIGSGDIASNLWHVRDILNRINIEQSAGKNSENIPKISLDPGPQNQELAQLIEEKVGELKTILNQMPSRAEFNEILIRLDNLKPSRTWEWLGRISDLIAIFDAVIAVFIFAK
jgi:HEAT repeat protein